MRDRLYFTGKYDKIQSSDSLPTSVDEKKGGCLCLCFPSYGSFSVIPSSAGCWRRRFPPVRLHRYVDRSVLFGPLCACYGITAVLLTVGLPELRGNYFFLFLGSAICSTVVEWIAGHLLEKATHTRWWDYSNRRGNLDGYICVGAFLLWGVLGLAAVQWINPLLLALYRWRLRWWGKSCCGCCWPCWRRTSRAPC